MSRVIALLRDKKFRYGTLSTIMALFAVAIFVLVNLVAGQFNFTRDLTRDKMYSLSRFSIEYLRTLDQDITIYALFRTGQENLMLKQILEEYKAASPHISLEYRDPLLYPTFVEQFAAPGEQVATNSVIVQSASKHKIIPPGDMYSYALDYNTFQQRIVGIEFEPQISRAIQFVTLDEAPKVYHAIGNNELPLPENLIKELAIANYDFEEINLIHHEIPDDCDILLLTLPERDWSTDMAERVLTYLQNEGNAIFLMGYRAERFVNMDNVLSAYGIALGDYIVLEGNSNHYYMGNPSFIIPGMVPGEITQPIIDKRFYPLFVQTTGIDVLPLKRNSTNVEPILVTSNASYAKNNPEAASINKEPGDLSGPFDLGVAVTDTWYTDVTHVTKFVVYACDYMLEESINAMFGGTNWDLIINSLNWLSEQPTSLHIPSKSPSSTQHLTMNAREANTIIFISVIGLPLLFAGTGIVVWLRRRHN